jgi:cytochrome c-type protein NapB
MREFTYKHTVAIACFVVISATVVGYFTGLQSPMTASAIPPHALVTHEAEPLAAGIIRATSYADMPAATQQRFAVTKTSLKNLKSNIHPLAEVKITPAEKTAALQRREQNRAFNGAPPTIPHAVDQTSTAACIACHGEGVKTQTLRIPRMSHQFLANCTQCHVEESPRHMTTSLLCESSFTGLPAPTGGSRAYLGAPPQIPHSTWMRSDCMSCHGYAGPQGIRTTHPWRKNCTQCHAPSSKLDQTLMATEPQFLKPPEVE